METFMDAPVRVHAEEAGDAEIEHAPHHGYSIPVCAASGNRGAPKTIKDEKAARHETPTR
jgi:hypothetical protein